MAQQEPVAVTADEEPSLKYYLSTSTDGSEPVETEVTKEEYIAAEVGAGFHTPAKGPPTEPLSESWSGYVPHLGDVRAWVKIPEPPQRSDSEIYRGAADLIETHGLVKGAYGSPERGFCAAGAIRWMCGVGGKLLDAGWMRYSDLTQRATRVTETRWGMPVTMWNDHSTTTQAQVVAFLREMGTEVVTGGR